MDSEDLDEAAGTNAFASPFETAAQTASEPAADVSAESTPHIRHPLVPSDEAELNDCLAAFVADENAKQMSSFEKYMAENGQEIPRLLAEIRSWGAFNVTDFVQQSWCEVKGRLRMRQDFGLDELDVVAVKVGDMPQVKMGRIIHEKKELETAHPKVEVKVKSREDSYAIKWWNLYFTLAQFVHHESEIEREIDICGCPDAFGVTIYGKIDEIRFDRDKYELTLVELKTRQTSKEPFESLVRSHALQLMLYKVIWDGITQDEEQWRKLVVRHKLDATSPLSPDVTTATSCSNLQQLITKILEIGRIAPRVNHLQLKYILQQPDPDAEETLIAVKNIPHDPAWLSSRIQFFLRAWRGEREMQGPQIEEAWKCASCEFAHVCEWRLAKEQSCRRINQLGQAKRRISETE